MIIYHNPRCRKSRETLEIIRKNDVEPEIILYLEQPPNSEEIRDLVRLLGIPPEELVRKTEAIYKEQFKGRDLTEEEWIEALSTYPKLMERPIVVEGDKAVIGRPPENVMALL